MLASGKYPIDGKSLECQQAVKRNFQWLQQRYSFIWGILPNLAKLIERYSMKPNSNSAWVQELNVFKPYPKNTKISWLLKLTGLSILFWTVFSVSVMAGSATTVTVMAPLDLNYNNQWSNFQSQLTIAKNAGVSAVSVDVWMGQVEQSADAGPGKASFDWSYYDAVFNMIINAGLKVVPIMSFHQCGGNVGDTCGSDSIRKAGNNWELGPDGNDEIAVPWWIWTDIAAANPGLSPDDLKFKSEQGNYSVESVSLWADHYILPQYQEFMEAFESHFANKVGSILEITIGMGPASELRYPSYNQHDVGTGFPTRGAFQAYGRLAVEDFRSWALNKYGSVSGVNSNWPTMSIDSITDINPPSDTNDFIWNSKHFNTQYGRDFVRWYHDSLVDHGRRVFDTAVASFDGAFATIELGFKMAGVHWTMSKSDSERRAAEVTAGLIPTDIDIDSDDTGHGYQDIIGLAASYTGGSHKTIFHFTALEKDDDYNDGQSMAKSLVFWVANEARRQNVIIKGENALSGGVTSDSGWDNIENAFRYANYRGITILRIGDVTWTSTGLSRLDAFNDKFLIPDVRDHDFKRTVVFIYGDTQTGQDMFFRGGIDHDYANSQLGRNCQTWNYECAIPIVHNNLKNTTTVGWKASDKYLDWYDTMESYQDSTANGSAADWTTNYWPLSWGQKRTVLNDGYGEEPLNNYGDHYWMFDVDMDCSKTVNGWFEVKSYISNGPGFESNVSQAGTPYSSGNHFGQCGKINVFQRDNNSVTISDF